MTTTAPTTRPTVIPDLRSRPLTPGWRGIGWVFWYSFVKLVTNPYSVGFAVLMPTFMYLMFGAGQAYSQQWTVNSNVAAVVLVNMALYGTIMTTSSMGSVVALERTSGISRLYAMTPLSSMGAILARIGAAMLTAAVVTGIVFSVGALTGARMYPGAWVQAALLIVGLSALPAAVGLACAFLVRSDGAFALTSGITVVGSFAAGLFIPLNQMGSFWAAVAPWTPFYGMTNIVQLSSYGWAAFKWSWLLNYLAWTVMFALAAAWGNRRNTGR